MAQGDFGNQLNLPRLEPPKVSGGLVRTVILAILVIFIAFDSFYQVEPEEIGVVLRFGAYKKQTPPGLHYKLPFAIDRVVKVPVQRQQKAEFGFRTEVPGVRSQFSSRGLGDESNMLTGDLNAAVVEWVVQYRIVDPYKYLFQVRNVEDTFRDMSEAVMREVVGDRTVNEVLTVGRQEIASVVFDTLQELSDQYEAGIKVDQVVLQDVTPPDPVKPMFNEVNQAQQEREKLINEAQAAYNRVIPRARGQALQVIQQAEGYALDRVNRAQGEATRFDAVYDEFRKAPEVTRKRMYLETMSEVIPNLGRKIVVDDELSGVVPLLNLDGSRPLRPAAGSAPGAGQGGSQP